MKVLMFNNLVLVSNNCLKLEDLSRKKNKYNIKKGYMKGNNNFA